MCWSHMSNAIEIDGDEQVIVDEQLLIKDPQPWSVDTPQLYRLETELRADGELRDLYKTYFGIRSLHFDADKGFFLNGEPMS